MQVERTAAEATALSAAFKYAGELRLVLCFASALLLFGFAGFCRAEPYVTMKLGSADADLSFGTPFNGDIDDSGWMYGIDVGYRFPINLAVEAGYSFHDALDGRATPCPADTVCPQVIVSVEDNTARIGTVALRSGATLDSILLYTKLGYFRGEIDTRTRFPADEFTAEGLLFSLGLSWLATDTWSIGVEASGFDDELRQYVLTVGWNGR